MRRILLRLPPVAVFCVVAVPRCLRRPPLPSLPLPPLPSLLPSGGEGGIRTHETLAGLLAFEASAIDRTLPPHRRTLSPDTRVHGRLRRPPGFGCGAPGPSRTGDLQLRRLLLYPPELRGRRGSGRSRAIDDAGVPPLRRDGRPFITRSGCTRLTNPTRCFSLQRLRHACGAVKE